MSVRFARTSYRFCSTSMDYTSVVSDMQDYRNQTYPHAVLRLGLKNFPIYLCQLRFTLTVPVLGIFKELSTFLFFLFILGCDCQVHFLIMRSIIRIWAENLATCICRKKLNKDFFCFTGVTST